MTTTANNKTTLTAADPRTHRTVRCQTPARRSTSLITSIHAVVVALIAALALPLWSYDVNDLQLRYCVCLLLTALPLWCIYSWSRVTRDHFHPYTLILAGCFLFNAGRAFLEVFGKNVNGILGPEVSPGHLIQTMYLVCLCMAALHLGALLATAPRVRDSNVVDPRSDGHPGPRQLVVTMLLISGIFAAVRLGNDVRTVNSAGYLALYQSQAATGINGFGRILADYFVPSAFLLVGIGRGRPRLLALSAAAIVLFAVTTLYIGGRSQAAMVLLPFVWLWGRCVRPIRNIVIAGVCLVLLVVFAVVGEVRTYSANQRASIVSDMQTSFQDSAIATLSEMGRSMSTVAHTVDLVPSLRPYDLGASYFYSALALIPNLYWDVHPTVARGTPQQWLVETVQPDVAARGGGLGFSPIAEAYLNFGWFGAPVVMLAFGFGWVKFCAWAERGADPVRLATLAVATYWCIALVRNDSTALFRGLVWFSLGPYALIQALPFPRIHRFIRGRSSKHSV
jgi:O-antigen polysaccharide polymerase Wzy